jgi:hypothetical protein
MIRGWFLLAPPLSEPGLMRFYGLIRNKNLKDSPYYTNQDCFMRKHIQLNIPKPCHENWDQMTPVDK